MHTELEFAFAEFGAFRRPRQGQKRLYAGSLVINVTQVQPWELFYREYYATYNSFEGVVDDRKIKTLAEAKMTLQKLHNALNENEDITLQGLCDRRYTWLDECEYRHLISDYDLVNLVTLMGGFKD